MRKALKDSQKYLGEAFIKMGPQGRRQEDEDYFA